METDIITLTTFHKRVIATFALFLGRTPTADDAAFGETIVGFLDFCDERESFRQSRLRVCKAIDRAFPPQRHCKHRRESKPYCVLPMFG